MVHIVDEPKPTRANVEHLYAVYQKAMVRMNDSSYFSLHLPQYLPLRHCFLLLILLPLF